MKGCSRDSWAEIHLHHVKENIHSFQHHLADDVDIMAVVKADGYGHGAVEVARTALRAGASWLGVAILDEAIALRKAGIIAPILVFGWVRPEDAPVAARLGISLTVFQHNWLIEAKRHHSDGRKLNVHLKLDTGMGRIGARDRSEIAAIVKAVHRDDSLHLEGVFTHFATADERDSSYFKKQYTRFETMLSWLDDWRGRPEIIHCANSATAIHYPGKVFNLIRLGIAMYGLAPSLDMVPTLPFPLKQAFTLHSRLVHVKQIEPGDAISYGATYVAREREWIGTVPLGYADGWLRKIAKKGEVLVDGKRAPIVGRICMDFFMVRLPENKKIGTLVTLIGKQGNERIDVEDIASQLETITYEIPCMISGRVPRIYTS
ncbi:MAG TPA: alanine racemase [Bacillales bacterium]|nr:alanine racemase [Bacillales bacterium]